MQYFLDLFAGIGGFALGAEWACLQFDEHYFSEVDPYAIKIYQKRFPDAVAIGDIRAIRGADLPEGEWIIAGGFPEEARKMGAGNGGQLNPTWVEWLMGYPLGWTDLNASVIR